MQNVAPSSRKQGADHQFRIGVDSDRYVAATYAAADDEGSLAVDIEATAAVGTGQRSAGGKNLSTVPQGDLTAMRMSGERDIELMPIQQQQTVR